MRFKTVGRRLHEMYCISALVRGAQRMGDPPRRISDERQITRLFGDLNTAVSGHPPELGIAELEGSRGRQLVGPRQPGLRTSAFLVVKLPDSRLSITDETGQELPNSVVLRKTKVSRLILASLIMLGCRPASGPRRTRGRSRDTS